MIDDVGADSGDPLRVLHQRVDPRRPSSQDPDLPLVEPLGLRQLLERLVEGIPVMWRSTRRVSTNGDQVCIYWNGGCDVQGGVMVYGYTVPATLCQSPNVWP
jgi:hypothetical protein